MNENFNEEKSYPFKRIIEKNGVIQAYIIIASAWIYYMLVDSDKLATYFVGLFLAPMFAIAIPVLLYQAWMITIISFMAIFSKSEPLIMRFIYLFLALGFGLYFVSLIVRFFIGDRTMFKDIW